MFRSSLQQKGEKTPAHWLIDALVTFICWGYFIFAFLFFFSFFYAFHYFFAADREQAFQYLNHRFFLGFLTLLRTLTPRYSWSIDPAISELHGSIIVCNHLSYLDPLLFLSLLQQNKTIVKTRFFTVPVFGWIISVSGYLPATTEGKYARKMIDQVEKMGEFFKSGGNLFIFPEGTRKSGANVDVLHKGVFKIARMYKRPIQIVRLSGTDKLFTPGRFFFNTGLKNYISLEIIDIIEPGMEQGEISVSILEEKVRHVFFKQKTLSEGKNV